MRLIDADALKKSFGDQRLDGDWCICGDETTARDLIDEAPIIDAEPVRHGKWLEEKTGEPVPFKEKDGCPEKSCNCSECGEWLVGSNEYPVKGNYCPNCGAKMDLND